MTRIKRIFADQRHLWPISSKRNSMEIQNKTFLVSGGGSGLGAATAKLLADSGANVVVADIRRETGEATANAIGAKFIECNVTDEESVKAAVAFLNGEA